MIELRTERILEKKNQGERGVEICLESHRKLVAVPGLKSMTRIV